MKMFRLSLLCFVLSFLNACIPYPAYKTIKPEANFLVTDANKKPIEGVKIVLNTRASPTPINEFDIQYTNLKGMTVFAGKKELTVEHTGMHGALDYFWNLCIEKAGFQTVKKQIENASDLSGAQVIKLEAGKSESCVAGDA
jgi:hypothetical protein